MALSDDKMREMLFKLREIWDQLRGPGGGGWPQLDQSNIGQNLTLIDAIAVIKSRLDHLQPPT